ncbi:Stb4p NDAI_0B01540 [Naumovozyma dairenensis CBS 421]|uniref:Zn(2)-C6 fungal-type domain-containing protein n=1 Tax=Naumovozyma dairenensis (strain ATCC 10597 / BCRC 20456 / CBS 421 / NBRC 0211 / NRRL Y-12639) TaxID=1071378 RepID=G0W5X7_NAUDC|nr:hypothetical protein NDAI_0B01540 [Naumovozyma dairenensis CBS 421]CCD23188.1 hypothetical protein NDAI_0B01540 [Naumovozyma dairenensis CBS 421]
MNMTDINGKEVTNKNRQRLRVQRACAICKKRKVKCDGMKPCSNCIKRSKDCTYTTAYKIPNMKYSPSLSPSSKTHSVSIENSPAAPDASLDIRLHQKKANHVTKILRNTERKPEEALVIDLLLGLGNNAPSSSTSSTAVSINNKNNNNNNNQSTEDDLIRNDKLSAIVSPSKREQQQQNCQPIHHFSQLSFSHEKYRFHRRYQNLLPYYFGKSLISELSDKIIKDNNLEIPRIQNYAWNLSGGHYLKFDITTLQCSFSNSLSSSTTTATSSQFFDFENIIHLSIIRKLLTFYFKEINKPFNIIHESMFWDQYNNVFIQQEKQKNIESTKLFKSMLYLIIITTLRFQEGFLEENDNDIPHTKLTKEEKIILESLKSEKALEDSMFNYSYSIISKLTFEWESFELIQSWLLITFYLRTCYRQTSSWHALGQAINLCNGMSLHLNEFPHIHSKYEESKLFHCFWACFIIDKFISFQLGRFYLLPLPIHHMEFPSESNRCNDGTDWFSKETIQLFHLSLIIMELQNRNAEELTFEQCVKIRNDLANWFDVHIATTVDEFLSSSKSPAQIQPLISYLDVRLSFEIKYLFHLINPPDLTTPWSHNFPTDIRILINNIELSITLIQYLLDEKLFFVPWWLNLSQLFTASLSCIILIHSGIQSSKVNILLKKAIDIWNSLENSNPKNKPTMISQCLWCLRMLSKLSRLGLMNSHSILENLVGENNGDNSPNKNKFSQFGKVDEKEDESSERVNENGYTNDNAQSSIHQLLNDPSLSATLSSSVAVFENNSTNLLEDGLFSNLQWFDQDFAL